MLSKFPQSRILPTDLEECTLTNPKCSPMLERTLCLGWFFCPVSQPDMADKSGCGSTVFSSKILISEAIYMVKFQHTRDTECLDVCGQQHRYTRKKNPSHVTCHLPPTPTATATDPPPANSITTFVSGNQPIYKNPKISQNPLKCPNLHVFFFFF